MRDIRLDLHIHSVYSEDSSISIDDIITYSKKKGLDGFAVCDHDTLGAYEQLMPRAQKKGLIAIPGMEIKTSIGEVIGLFIEREIDIANNDFFSIVKEIKEVNGLVVIPHPYDFLRRNHLKMSLLNDNIIKKYIDGIELINSRILFSSCIEKARRFKKTHTLFETGGSDAHHRKEIGNGYTLIKNMNKCSLHAIKRKLMEKQSKSLGKRSSPHFHFVSIFNKILQGTLPVLDVDIF